MRLRCGDHWCFHGRPAVSDHDRLDGMKAVFVSALVRYSACLTRSRALGG